MTANISASSIPSGLAFVNQAHKVTSMFQDSILRLESLPKLSSKQQRELSFKRRYVAKIQVMSAYHQAVADVRAFAYLDQ